MFTEKSDKYREFFTSEFLMGPNCFRLLDELISKYPVKKESRILDLGCGTGLTSMFMARETNSQILAVDLWCSATDNYKNFQKWGIDDKVIPIFSDAAKLPFAGNYFDAVISVDSYHYFALSKYFFKEKVLPLVKSGGYALIAVPGLKKEFTDSAPKEMLDWLEDEVRCFHSCEWWRDTIGCDKEIESVTVWEMENFDIAWDEWLATGAKYAVHDKKAFDNGVGKYLNFVGIAVKKA